MKVMDKFQPQWIITFLRERKKKIEKKKEKKPKFSTTSLEGFQSILVCAWFTQSAEYCGHIFIDLKKTFHKAQVNQIWLLQEI